MAVPLEQFLKHLEDSGILAGDTIKEFIPPVATPKDAEELARELVRKKKLTKFQAEEVYRGKGKLLVLGNYVLVERIGAGGMGQVFKARHRRMDRMVAVKLLPSAMTKEASAIARFEREVRAAAKINHPNIVAALDADCAHGSHFLVMELVDGRDLSVVVKSNGALAVEQAVDYIIQAGRGLVAAHAEGIVHRDIKPANLLLDKKGVVKILDMGLARFSSESDRAQSDLTSTGTIMGTIDYMAPEQALDTKTADARADIYSLGCTLFYLLTARATFEGDTIMKKLLAHREQPIPMLAMSRPEVPDDIDRVFQKMLAKKVEDRYQTMAAVVEDLEACRSGRSVAAQPGNAQSDEFDDGGLTSFLQDISAAPKSTPPPKGHRKATAKPSVRKTPLSADTKKYLMIGGGVAALLIMTTIIAMLRTGTGTGGHEPNTAKSIPQSSDNDDKKSTTSAKEPTAEVTSINSSESAPLKFVDLFNGRDLSGWIADGALSNWTWDAKEHQLIDHGRGRGWLVSDRVYGDFVLELEFNPEDNANSGVGLLAHYGEQTMLELQLGRGPTWHTGGLWSMPNNTVHAGYLPVSIQLDTKINKWNTVQIQLRARQLTTKLNGVQVSQYDLGELAKKAGAFYSLARTQGRIALQSQSGVVRFRNVRIAELSPVNEAETAAMRPADWQGLNQFWKTSPQEIVGSTGTGNLVYNTCLTNKRRYRDFQLRCEVWLKRNNSGIQIRSEMKDQAKFIMKGPQVDIGEKYWGGVYGELTNGWMQQAPADFEQKAIKPNEFNDVSVRCVGKHVTIKINGQTSVDRDFPEIADEGLIGLQLHSGDTGVVFRNLVIQELK